MEPPIKCEWFPGSVREAMDVSLMRNEVAKLPIAIGDKFEAAWQRTLNNVGSKSEVVRLTGASEGVVAMMRRVKRHCVEKTPQGKDLKAKLGKPLDTASWTLVRATWLALTKNDDWSEDEAAAKLARQLTRRMTDTLSRNPRITAKALWLYDPDLCSELARELGRESTNRDQDETDIANLVEGA